MTFSLRPTRIYLTLILCCCALVAAAQEVVVPLSWNVSPAAAQQSRNARAAARKTTALSLPFFEDFLGSDPYPDPQRWVVNRQVYVNNTMGIDPIAQGVCTFDALGANNRPYDTVNPFGVRYADTLASQPFDLSAYSPGDSIYLSFFYQPQGAGFSPETTDSLMLFFRNKAGRWSKQWAKEGTLLQPFRQVLIPVTDTAYLYNGFQFRFINKASINLNDDVWNLDYVRMDAGRNWADTAVADIALTTIPGNLLGDYTAMPYRHYLAQTAAESAADIWGNFRNNSAQPVTGFVGINATNAANGTSFYTTGQPLNAPAYQSDAFRIPSYTAITQLGPQDPLVIRHHFSLTTSAQQASMANDTLTKLQVFDNYFAYDDGTAEKAYYLNLLPALPGKVAIEFHTNVADTLRGGAILFAQQVPTATGKFFNMEIYRRLAGVAGAAADERIHSQDFYQPRFVDTVNRFFNYTFETPVALPAGTYYFVVMQPALSGSDSLYYAVDANRVGSNHLFYNVDGTWKNSTLSGALMIRPLFGAPVSPTAVATVSETPSWQVYPNPSAGALSLSGVPQNSLVQVTDLMGNQVVAQWQTPATPDLKHLAAGTYFVRWKNAQGEWSTPQKWVLMPNP